MKPIKCIVHELMYDETTIMEKEFPSIRKAKEYIKNNGVKIYYIEKVEENKMITKKDIENLATEIKNLLVKYNVAENTCIYFNNKRWSCDYSYDGNQEVTYIWKEENNIDPHDYFEWAMYDHILSMSFEGGFYDVINYYGGKCYTEFENILSKYHVYHELGNNWNLTVCPVDDTKFEYTKYDKPKERINLYLRGSDEYPKEIKTIMDTWYTLSEKTGDIGSCVIGAGFEFTWNNENYFMSECSPWQGSISWETHVPVIKKMLEEIGATNVFFNYGVLD